MKGCRFLLTRAVAVVVLACGLQATSASATTIYASAVAGTSGTPSGNVGDTVGAPDALFIQLDFKGNIVLDFGSLSAGPTSLLVFTYDDLFPATASLEVSADNSSFVVVAASILDTNGTQSGSFYPSIAFDVASAYRYVRITDLGTSPAPYENLGFDLDAVGRATVPDTASTSLLLGLGWASVALLRRRVTKA